MLLQGLGWVVGGLGKGYVPKSIFILATLENGRSFAGDRDDIVVMDLLLLCCLCGRR